MKVVVVGTGYVGLACVGFVTMGHEVVGVDVDAGKIERLNHGELPIHEPGLAELVIDGMREGKLRFTTNLPEALTGADVCFVCVGTPSLPDGSVDLQYIEAAVASVRAAKEPQTVVVIKSTVPVGTCNRFGVVSNPEFLAEGRAVQDFLHPDRVVIGTTDPLAKEVMLAVYASLDCPKLVMAPASAELTKYAANGFLATKISFINEISAIAEKVGADIRDVAQAIGADPRIGPHFLRAGIGYGGSCFPKDTEALMKIADLNAVDFAMLKAAKVANDRARERFVQKVIATTGAQAKLAVWGLAFKAQTDDVRKSAAIDVIELLLARGASITVYDPMATENAKKVLGERVRYASTALEATTEADALLVLTEWPEFKNLIPASGAGIGFPHHIFDGRNLFADMHLAEKGYAYVGVGLGQTV